jgi:hypothetical protein
MRWWAVAATVALALAGVASADVVPAGGEFQVNQWTTGSQEEAVVARVPGTGELVVVFSSYGQDGSNDGIFVRRYAAAAMPLGSEFQVNTYTTGEQYHSAVAAAPDGRFVVLWSSPHDAGSNGVFGQRFDSAGMRVGTEFRLNAYTTDDQRRPEVAMDTAGAFVVAWRSPSPEDPDGGIFARRFGSDGNPAGTEFQVNVYTTGTPFRQRIAIDPRGGFLVVWDGEGVDGSVRAVIARRYDAAGNATTGEFHVNTYTTGSQYEPAVAFDPSGRLVIAWASIQDGDASGVYAQRFTSSGTPDGTEFRVNSYTPAHQYYTAVDTDDAGSFVIAWSSRLGQDGGGNGVFAQRYDSTGAPIGTNFQVNTYTTGNQGEAPLALAVDDDGDFIVFWDSEDGQDGNDGGVFGQRYQDPCGDGTVGAGEQCDTGKRVDRNCCTAACQRAASGTPCDDDGVGCTADACGADGACAHTAQVTACPACRVCDPAADCVVRPRTDCRRPTRSRKASLALTNKASDAKDRLAFTWQKGAATTLADLGTPTTSGDYALCVFDKAGGADRLVLDARLPAGGSWKARGRKGFTYKSRGGAPDGITNATLKPGGGGKATLAVQGKGAALGLPALGLGAPVTVQLEAGGRAACFGAEFAAPSANTPARFKAKGQ